MSEYPKVVSIFKNQPSRMRHPSNLPPREDRLSDREFCHCEGGPTTEFGRVAGVPVPGARQCTKCYRGVR